MHTKQETVIDWPDVQTQLRHQYMFMALIVLLPIVLEHKWNLMKNNIALSFMEKWI